MGNGTTRRASGGLPVAMLLLGAWLFPGAASAGLLFGDPVYDTSQPAIGVLGVDMDGDGDRDVVVASASGNEISLLRNDGSGVLSDGGRTVAAGRPVKLAAADLDGDGDLDVAAANETANSVSTYLNDGAGSLTLLASHPVGTKPSGIAVGDLDGDGNADVVVTCSTSATLWVLRGVGGAALAPGVSYADGTRPADVALGDVDGDGDLDVVSSDVSTDEIRVFRNDGTAALDAGVAYPVGPRDGANSLVLADLDGDGDLDAAVAEGSSSTGGVSILRNDGAGAFAWSAIFSLRSCAAVRAADYDGDGDVDLLAFAGANTGYLENDGSAQFVLVSSSWLTSGIQRAVADLDGDGDLDVAAANGNSDVVLALNLGEGRFGVPQVYAGSSFPVGLAAADLDLDGDADVAVANSSTGTLAVYRNDGSGALAAPIAYPLQGSLGAVTAARLDFGSSPDLIVADSAANVVRVLRSKGDGALFPPSVYAVGSYPISLASGDLDGDGDVDVAVANSGSDDVWVLHNDGTAALGSPSVLPAGDLPAAVVAVRVDTGASVDLVVANAGSDTLTVHLNDGAGGFAPPVSIASPGGPIALAAGDVDADSDTDLVVANVTSDTIAVFLGDGAGAFVPGASYPSGTVPTFFGRDPSAVVLGDLDRDGDPDIAAVNSRGATLAIFRNVGAGSFAPDPEYVVPPESRTLALADMDGDGDLDALATAYSASQLAVHTNLIPPPPTGCGRVGAGGTLASVVAVALVPLLPRRLRRVRPRAALVASILGCAACSTPTLDSMRELGASAGSTEASIDVASDAAGNVYVTGATSSAGGTTGVDIVTVKYDAAGGVVWSALYDGPGDDRPVAIAIVPPGDVAVVGRTKDPGTDDDALTVVYDSTGVERWSARRDLNGDTDAATDVVAGPDGSLDVAGYEGYCVIPFPGTVFYDCFYAPVTIRYAADGTESWSATDARARFSNTDTPVWSITGDGVAGGVYVAGRSATQSTWLARYDASGAKAWDATYGPTPPLYGSAASVAAGADGAVISGWIQGGNDMEAATIAYDGNGALRWARFYDAAADDSQDDVGVSVALDADGNAFVTAHSEVPAWGTDDDIVVLSYDPAGNERWQDRFDLGWGLDDRTTRRALEIDTLGNVYVAGSTEVPEGGNDLAVLAYRNDGTPLWDLTYSAPGFSTESTVAAALRGTCNLYVAGTGTHDAANGGDTQILALQWSRLLPDTLTCDPGA